MQILYPNVNILGRASLDPRYPRYYWVLDSFSRRRHYPRHFCLASSQSSRLTESNVLPWHSNGYCSHYTLRHHRLHSALAYSCANRGGTGHPTTHKTLLCSRMVEGNYYRRPSLDHWNHYNDDFGNDWASICSRNAQRINSRNLSNNQPLLPSSLGPHSSYVSFVE